MAQLTAADLLQPKGDITPDWFPTLNADGVNTLLGAYLEDAYNRVPVTIVDEVTQNNAARAWAMFRAWNNVLQRLINTPASFKVDNEGGQSIIAEQVKKAQQMADKYENEFATLTDVAETGSSIDDAGQGAAPTAFVW